MSISRRVLDRSIVSLPGIGFVFVMNAVAQVLRDEAKIHQVHVILFGPAVAHEQVLGLDVVVNVALAVNVFEDIDDLQSEIVSHPENKRE